MRRRMDWCDWRGVLHDPQRLLSFLMRDLWSGHAPQALVVVLGLLRPLTGREDDDRLIGAAYTHVGDRRYPGERRAQLGLARLRGVAGPGDLADARRVVVLGTRGQAALPPFCSAVLGRRRHRICGAPLHLRRALGQPLVWRALRAYPRWWRSLRWLAGSLLLFPYFAGGRKPFVCLARPCSARLCAALDPPTFSSTPLIRIDQIYACLERYSKLKELERRLRHRRIRRDETRSAIGLSMYRAGRLRRVFRARGKLVGTSDFVVTSGSRGWISIRGGGVPAAPRITTLHPRCGVVGS